MWDVRNITEADEELFRARSSQAFGRDADSDEAALERFHAIFDRERTFAAFDGDDIVGTVTAFSLGLTVPGGSVVPMGGTTVVSVKSTHRRRGVLRAMMDRHLSEIAERGEPLAGLWASEGSIYSRFGYGPATYRHVMEAGAESLTFIGAPDPGTTIRIVDPGKAGPVIRDVYERARVATSGALTRSDAWWDHRILADVESWRGGKSAQRYLVAEREGTPTGYAIYRQKSKWDDFIATGEVSVEEVISVDPSAHREIWRFLANVDLFPNLAYWNLPVQDPLPQMVTDQRRVRRSVSDGLWVRIMEVPSALEARTYQSDGAVTFRVSDPGRSPEGFRLEVVAGIGNCEPFTGDVDLTLTSDVLGHVYLGGGSAGAMAGAGRIEGDPTAVGTLDRLFRTAQAPWCPEVF